MASVTRARKFLSIPCSSQVTGVHIGSLISMIMMINRIASYQAEQIPIDLDECAQILGQQNNKPPGFFYEILKNSSQICEKFLLNGPTGKLNMPHILDHLPI